ncbi:MULTISPECIES: DUF7115 domain-containing protein [Salinibaculum]|uniref:DUF7115 domain-containing protein n=1 Tax=Salinibaculum TaxID=2732368 RepID=UPI0030CF7923
MEIPHLVREHLGDEAIEASVSLGDEDVVCVTPSRALVYRGEGLLSDESVSTYSLDLERFDISEGRRKTKFLFEYVDGTDTFTVPASRADSLLTLLLQAVLRIDGVIGPDESLTGVYQFSELTLVVAESRLVKHIGSTVWDPDFEVYDYDDVTGLDFEEGSVATQIVLTVGGRPQRIKAPNDQAPEVEQTLVQTLCTYHDVSSLDELQQTLAPEEEPTADDGETDSPSSASGDFGLEEGISPLVGDDAGASGEPGDAADSQTEATRSSAAGDRQRAPSTTSDRSHEATREPETPATDETSPEPTRSSAASTDPSIDPADIEAIQEQLAALTKVVRRQNELLEKHDASIETHDERIEQLIDELRRGR